MSKVFAVSENVPITSPEQMPGQTLVRQIYKNASAEQKLGSEYPSFTYLPCPRKTTQQPQIKKQQLKASSNRYSPPNAKHSVNTHMQHGGSKLCWRHGHLHPCRLQGINLLIGPTLSSCNDGAGMTHASPRGSSQPGDEGHHRFGVGTLSESNVTCHSHHQEIGDWDWDEHCHPPVNTKV